MIKWLCELPILLHVWQHMPINIFIYGSIFLFGRQSVLQFALFITLSYPNSAFLSHLYYYLFDFGTQEAREPC